MTAQLVTQPQFPPDLTAQLEAIGALVDWQEFNATVHAMATTIKETPLASHFSESRRISGNLTEREGQRHPSQTAAFLTGHPPGYELTEAECKREQLLRNLGSAQALVVNAVIQLKQVQIDLYGATNEFEFPHTDL